MAYFTHQFETRIARHAVGTYHYTVVYFDPALQPDLPLDRHARLRIEADVAGIPVKGAWQPARGRWYLMLPKAPLKAAGLRFGSSVDVSFRVLPQDDVDIPEELATLLVKKAGVRKAWQALRAGKQRGLAYLVASAKRVETRRTRLAAAGLASAYECNMLTAKSMETSTAMDPGMYCLYTGLNVFYAKVVIHAGDGSSEIQSQVFEALKRYQ